MVLALNVLLVGFNLGSLSFTGLGIDVLRASLATGAPTPSWPGGWQPGPEWSTSQVIALVAAVVLVFSLFNGVCKYVTAIVSARLSQMMVISLRAEVYDKLQRLSFRFFDSHDSSGIIGRVAGDVQAIRQFVDGVILKILTVILSLGIYTSYMLSLHVPLTLACLCTSPLLWFGAVAFSR